MPSFYLDIDERKNCQQFITDVHVFLTVIQSIVSDEYSTSYSHASVSFSLAKIFMLLNKSLKCVSEEMQIILLFLVIHMLMTVFGFKSYLMFSFPQLMMRMQEMIKMTKKLIRMRKIQMTLAKRKEKKKIKTHGSIRFTMVTGHSRVQINNRMNNKYSEH